MATTDLSSFVGQEVKHLTVSPQRVTVETATAVLTVQLVSDDGDFGLINGKLETTVNE